jgi:hypothetical protein
MAVIHHSSEAGLGGASRLFALRSAAAMGLGAAKGST